MNMKINSINTCSPYNKNSNKINQNGVRRQAFGMMHIDKYDMNTVCNSEDLSVAIKKRDFKLAYDIMNKLSDNYDPNWTDKNGVPLLLQIADAKPRFPFFKFSEEQRILKESIMRDLISHHSFKPNNRFYLKDKRGVSSQTSYLDEAVSRGNTELLLMLSQYARGLDDPHGDFFNTLLDKSFVYGDKASIRLALKNLQDMLIAESEQGDVPVDNDDVDDETVATGDKKVVNKEGAALLDGAKVDVSSDSIPASLDEVGGIDKSRKDIEDFIIKPWEPETRDKLLKNKIAMPNGFLMFGPPGTGKTFLASVISKQTGYPMYLIMLGSIGSTYVSGTANNIFNIFDELHNRYKATGKPSILFLDEIDDMGSSREDNSSSSKREDTNTLLSALNNASEKGIIVIGATNYIEAIDKAIMRSGRLDKKIELTLPNKEERISILTKILEKKEPEVVKTLLAEVNTLADLTDGKSPADLAYYINTAARQIVYDNRSEITLDDFKKAMECPPLEKPRAKIGF